MKKTLTVNLNSIVFHIDDDAYEMLQRYLHEIANHFQSEDEKKEIMADIEARIAELFNEKLQKNKNVISLVDVEEIIEIMGNPSQYTDEEEETSKTSKNDKKQSKSRRFYRDPENSVLGGVAGGLAAYFNLDVTWIRIILVLLVFMSVSFIVPVYIVVWFVAPAAITATQRLEMQGEDVTVENIKTEINNVKNYMESEKFKSSARTVGERILDVLRWSFKLLFGFIGIIFGMVGIIVVVALILALFLVIFEPGIMHGLGPDFMSNSAMMSPEKIVFFVISLILLIGGPIVLLIYWAIRLVSGRHQSNHTISWVVLVLWFAGLFMFFGVGGNALIHLNKNQNHHFGLAWSDEEKPLVDEVRSVSSFQSIELSGNIELILKKDTFQNVVVSCPEDFNSKLKTEVENGVLKIYSDQILMNRTLKVTVSSNSIKNITAKGACKISTENQLIYPELSLVLLGASEADLDVNILGLMNLEAKGASHVELKGIANTLKINGVGASEIEAESLIAKSAEIHVTGATHANVYASESINAEAHGASEIECKGHPKSIKKSDSGGSSINIE